MEIKLYEVRWEITILKKINNIFKQIKGIIKAVKEICKINKLGE